MRKERLQQWLDDVHYKNYKKDKSKSNVHPDKRMPKLKITEDIFSCSICFKDKEKKETRIFLDGTVYLNTLTITSVTIEGTKFSPAMSQALVSIFQQISNLGNGVLIYEIDEQVYRLSQE